MLSGLQYAMPKISLYLYWWKCDLFIFLFEQNMLSLLCEKGFCTSFVN